MFTFNASFDSILDGRLEDIPLSPNFYYALQLLLNVAWGTFEGCGSRLRDNLGIGKLSSIF